MLLSKLTFKSWRFSGLAALCFTPFVSALELPLPAPGEDVVGEVQVIQARAAIQFESMEFI